MFDIESVCANCVHWLGKKYGDMAECAVKAVQPDMGEGVEALVLLPADGNCRAYDEAFEPHPDYLYVLNEWEHQNDGL